MDFRISLEPASQMIDGRTFTGFKYWFEFESGGIAIHRIVDRQTWEIGGDLSDVSVVCRNLFDLPRKKVAREGSFSSVGIDNWSGLLPGNLWARWSLLPAFDMQYGKACAQFGIRGEEPPAIVFSKNVWNDFVFDSTYDDVLEAAAEFGADYIFIDPCWQNMETYQRTLRRMVGEEKLKGSIFEKLSNKSMCCSLDFEVSEIAGGEVGLKRLCDRARAKKVKVISWMATHYFGASMLCSDSKLGHGLNAVIAAKESGRHPDTGYPVECLTINLNSCCGLHGGNIYADDLLGYSYNTAIALFFPAAAGQPWMDHTTEMMRGRKPIDELFQCFAHKRIVGVDWFVPRTERDLESTRRIKELFSAYKANRSV